MMNQRSSEEQWFIEHMGPAWVRANMKPMIVVGSSEPRTRIINIEGLGTFPDAGPRFVLIEWSFVQFVPVDPDASLSEDQAFHLQQLCLSGWEGLKQADDLALDLKSGRNSFPLPGRALYIAESHSVHLTEDFPRGAALLLPDVGEPGCPLVLTSRMP